MKLFGIRIRVHPTFLWLLCIMLVVTRDYEYVGLVLLVFVFVVLHELSHSLVARAHGISVLDITLLPIGGVARLGQMPERAGTEFKIAVAGPLLNFAIVGLVYLISAQTGWPLAVKHQIIGAAGQPLIDAAGRPVIAESATLLGMILTANLWLGGFNLLPAFPMDGGRLLRAFLARKRGYLQATHIAARVGRWIAGAMAAYSIGTLISPSLRWDPWLLVIAVFIYVSGKQEEMAVAARHAEQGLWRLFGYGQTPYDERTFSAGAPPTGAHGDVIDVQGTVRREDRGDGHDSHDAADAFRKLGDEIDSHLGR